MPVSNPEKQTDKVMKTKQRLVAATLESLKAEGIEGCSVRKIAERAEVSTGLINYHYPTVQHLVADAYSHLAFTFLESGIAASANYMGDPRKQMSVFIKNIFADQVMQREVLRAWVVFWGLIDSSREMQKAHKSSSTALTSHLENLFAALLSNSSALSPKMAANGLSALIDGLWLEWCLQTESFTCDDCARICEHWVDSLIVGTHNK